MVSQVLSAYWQYMVTICELLGWDKAAAERAMSDVIEFESEIALVPFTDNFSSNFQIYDVK